MLLQHLYTGRIGRVQPLTFTPNSAILQLGCPRSKGWKKFASTELGYSIYFPGTPEEDTYKDNGGSYIRYSALGDGRDINYSVSLRDFLPRRRQMQKKNSMKHPEKRKSLTNFAKLVAWRRAVLLSTIDGYLALHMFACYRKLTRPPTERCIRHKGLYGLESLACPRPRPALRGYFSYTAESSPEPQI